MPSPAPNTYSFDGSGTLAANLVQDELHTLTVINFRDYHYVIPNFAPFFAESLVVQFRDDPIEPYANLIEGIDYYPALQYIGATRATGKPIYGALSFNNLSLAGELKITYQTVGGEWTLDVAKLTELTANIIYNPRTTTWEQVTTPPAHFPPLAHAWQLDDLVGQSEILSALDAIEQAILDQDIDADLLNHITNYTNPHRVTKSQVGLGKVQNYSPATIAETIAAQSAELYVTPIGLRAYIDSLGLDQALNFVSLQEVVDRAPVAKILTFDLFLEYMRLYGDGDDPRPPQSNDPVIIYPTEQSTYVKDQIFKCTTFVDTTPGTVNRIINITGSGSHSIPAGTGSVKITGRGGIGGVSAPGFVTKTEVVSGLGTGTFTIPAGGNILSIRGRGAAGVSGRTRKYTIDPATFTPVINATDNPGVVVTDITVNSLTPVTNIEFGAAFSVTANISVTYTYDSGAGASASETKTGNVTYSFTANDNGTSHGFSTIAGNGNFWYISTPPDLTSDHETLVFAETINPNIPTLATGSPHSLSLKVRTTFELNRQTGTESLPGANASTTINGAVRTYSGSSSTATPAERVDEVPIVATTSTVVNYTSPPGTVVELVYQDYTAAGVWEIKRYYSSKITNPATGTAALVEDTNGSVVALPVSSTGDWMSTRTSVVLEPTTAINTAYALQLVASGSNSARRVFEYKYTLSGTEVTIRIISELITGGGTVSQGPSAVVTLMGRTETYAGSPDNNTVPQTRTDEIVLNTGAETIVNYVCPTGTSVVLNYNEPNTAQPITHADTVWEVSTSNSFSSSTIVEGTVIGKGASFTLTNWKPTTTTVLINNTDYFVRVKWIRSDASESSWSEIKRFTYSSGITHPPRDTELSRFCKQFDQWGTFADGNGGSYEREISKNSIACGYVTPTPSVTTSNVLLNNCTLISSLSTIPAGGTSTLTVSFKDTVPGRSYKFEWYSKLSSQPDSAYQKSTSPDHNRSFTGDSGSGTTIITVPLAHTPGTVGAYNGKVIITDDTNPANRVESNTVTISFASAPTGTGTATPTPTLSGTTTPAPTYSPNAITISSTHTELRSGTTERITVTATSAVPNNTVNADIYSIPTTVTVGATPDASWTSYKIGTVSISTNSAGNGSRTIDNYVASVGAGGAAFGPAVPTSHIAGTYRTFAYVTGSFHTGKTNEIFRTFIASAVANKKIALVASPTSISVGQSSTIQTNLTDFDPNSSYSVRIFHTPAGGSRTLLTTTNVSTNSSGSGTNSINFTNTGALTAGNHGFDATVSSTTGADVPTPGGNIPANIAVQINTQISFTSSLGENPNVAVGSNETLTINVSGAPVNQTLNCVMATRWLSGNSSGINTSIDYNTPFTITTNSTGSGSTTIPAGNNGSIPAPSVWSRRAIISSSGITSTTKNANFISPAAAMTLSIQSSMQTADWPQVRIGDPETINITVANGPANQTIAVNLRAMYVSGNSSGVTPGFWYNNPFSITLNSAGNGSTNVPGGNNGAIPTPSTWKRQAIYEPTGVTSAEAWVGFLPAATPAPTITYTPTPTVPNKVNNLRLYHHNGAGFVQTDSNTIINGDGGDGFVGLGVVCDNMNIPVGTSAIVLFTTQDGKVFHAEQFTNWGGNVGDFGADEIPANRIWQASHRAFQVAAPHSDIPQILGNNGIGNSWGYRLRYYAKRTIESYSLSGSRDNTVNVILTLHLTTGGWSQIAQSDIVYKFRSRPQYVAPQQWDGG